MTLEQKRLFEKLSLDRQENAKAIEKPSMRGIKDSVVEKYSDQAHFIYELLQNADDVGATDVQFCLLDEKLIFKHNGTRHFFVTDVENEENDTKEKCLGDLNSITSIGNSSKKESTIGKFGVGFKAVFQYTETPYIYDRDFKFKIERFVVPVQLEDDFPNRKENETVFVFPFNNKELKKEDAYLDISNKLQNLVFPVLFLNNLKTISFSGKGVSGRYTKEILSESSFNKNTIGRFLSVKYNKGDDVETELLWTFSRRYEKNGLEYTVGFFVEKEDENNEKKLKKDVYNLVSRTYPAFCYFPTKVSTGLNFIIHAPFLLTDSREGIKVGEEYNHIMIGKLAELAGDSLLYLRDVSKDCAKNFIDDNLLDIFPYYWSFGDNRQSINFSPFTDAVENVLSSETVLPSENNSFVEAKDAYIAESRDIERLFNEDKLKFLTKNKNAKWVFESSNFNENQLNFITEILRGSRERFYENETNGIDIQREAVLYFRDFVNRFSDDFIENQDFEWLNRLYGFICETKQRQEFAKTHCIFLDDNKKAVAAFENGHQRLFLPSKDVTGYATINKELLQKKYAKQLLIDVYNISEPSLKDEIYNKIIPAYNDDDAKINTKEHFKKIFAFYLECSKKEKYELINTLKNISFVKYKKINSEKGYRGLAGTTYFPDEKLKNYFLGNPDIRFLDLDKYKEIMGEGEKYLCEFFYDLGVSYLPRIIKKDMRINDFVKIDDYKNISLPNYTSYSVLFEKSIEGLHNILEEICLEQNFSVSIVLWDILLEFIRNYDKSAETFRTNLEGRFNYQYYSLYSETFDSRSVIWLQNRAWIVDFEGNFVSPNTITMDDLSEQYNVSDECAKELAKFLGIKESVSKQFLNKLSKIERNKFKLGILAYELKLTEADLHKTAEQKHQQSVSSIYNLKQKEVHGLTIFDIYNLWLEDYLNNTWENKLSEYRNDIIPTKFSFDKLKDELEWSEEKILNYKEGTIPQHLCALLMLAMLQSSAYWGHSQPSRKTKIDKLWTYLEMFCNGENIQDIYDSFLKEKQFNEDELSEFETLLRIYKIRKNYEDFRDVLRTLPTGNKSKTSELLIPPNGSGMTVFCNSKTLKLGISLLIRELLENGFYDSFENKNDLNKFTYMPNLQLRRIVDEENNDKITSEQIFVIIRDELKGKEYLQEFLNCHDYPFRIYGEQKNDSE